MFREVLLERVRGVVELSPARISLLENHYALLRRWNAVLNLTRIEDEAEAAERHYGESLFLGAHLPHGEWRIADIGSGGGFPGIPVGILRPECSVTLIESHQRKAVFLKEACRALANVRIVAKRAEDVADKFDRAISRAVSYSDLTRSLKELAPAVDLLTGAEAPPREMGFVWSSPIALPWGRQRFLRVGRLDPGVSRGTPS